MDDTTDVHISGDFKYYDKLPPPASGTIATEFQNMEAEDLVQLSQALEENPLRDAQQTEVFVYAQYQMFLKTRREEYLNIAISTLEQALADIDSSNPSYDRLLHLTTVMHSMKSLSSRQFCDLEAATYRAQDLLSITDPLHPERYSRWLGIVTLLGRVAAVTGSQVALDEIMDGARAAVGEAAKFLDANKEETYSPGDKTLHMQKLKEALAVTPPDHYGRDVWLDTLSTLAWLHWKHHDQDPVALDQAILLGEKGISAAPDETRKSLRLFCLGNCLVLRFEEYGHHMEDLNAGIRRIEQSMFTSSFDRDASLLQLHNVLQLRFRHTNRVVDLERACRIIERILARMPLGDPERPLRQDFLAMDLTNLFKYKRTKALQDFEQLDRAIVLNREVYEYLEKHPKHPEGPRLLNNYASHLTLRFEQKDTLSDLHLAGDLYTKAISHPYERDRDRPRYLSALVAHLIRNFQRLGNVDDLDKAIRRGEEALVDTSGNFAEKSRVLDAIRNALANKSDATGDESLLREAIKRGEEAVAVSSVLDHEKRLWINNLSGSYLRLYERSNDIEDIEKAINTQKEAIRITPPDHESLPLLSTRFSQCLLMRYSHDNVKYRQDLDTAIDHMRRAVAVTPEDHLDRAGRTIMLAQLLCERCEQIQDLTEIDEAIDIAREAVRLSPSERPLTAEIMDALARCLDHRFRQKKDPMDLIEAAMVGQAGMDQELSPAHIRIRCAIVAINSWHQLGRAEAVAEVSEKAVFMLRSVSSRALQQTDQQYMLRRFAGFTTMAVAAAFAIGKSASHCLEILEFGRGIINGLRFDSRIDVTLLEAKRPDLAARFVSIQNQLDQLPTQSQGEAMIGPGVRTELNRKHELTREFEGVLRQIRDVEGFEMFLEPPRAKDLARVSTSPREAVVVINAGSQCDAILVQNGKIDHLHLPLLREEDKKKCVRPEVNPSGRWYNISTSPKAVSYPGMAVDITGVPRS